jgi:endosialidase-like protein
LFNTTGSQNTAHGALALFKNTSGADNTAAGFLALGENTVGSGDTANGVGAIGSKIVGDYNTAIGFLALGSSTSGSHNIALGDHAGSNVSTSNNVICIGLPGRDISNTCFIGNVRGVTTQNADAIPVLVDSAGQLGTTSSSRRFKKEIKPMSKASEAILALKPVTFQYKSDKIGMRQFGLIAEEVAEVSPDLVVRDDKGEIYTVRYDAVNAMLLNEFLKEHQKVAKQESGLQRQGAIIAQQQKQIEALTAGLQKVTAQLELNKSAPQTVLTGH